PIVLLGVDFWSPLVDWIRGTLVEQGMISGSDTELFLVTDSVTDSVEFIRDAHRRAVTTSEQREDLYGEEHRGVERTCARGPDAGSASTVRPRPMTPGCWTSLIPSGPGSPAAVGPSSRVGATSRWWCRWPKRPGGAVPGPSG